MMNDQDFEARKLALNLANAGQAGWAADRIVQTAEQFYDFLVGAKTYETDSHEGPVEADPDATECDCVFCTLERELSAGEEAAAQAAEEVPAEEEQTVPAFRMPDFVAQLLEDIKADRGFTTEDFEGAAKFFRECENQIVRES